MYCVQTLVPAATLGSTTLLSGWLLLLLLLVRPSRLGAGSCAVLRAARRPLIPPISEGHLCERMSQTNGPSHVRCHLICVQVSSSRLVSVSVNK